MRKSTFSIASHLYNRLSKLDVLREITGGLYKDSRPMNSGKEDIVVSAGGQIAESGGIAKAKVMIFTSPVISDRGEAVEMVPDYKRLEYLSGRVYDGIDEVFSGGCLTWVEAQSFSQQGDMFCCVLDVAVSIRGAV